MEISQQLKILIEKYGFNVKKNLGQNFLVASSAINFIANAVCSGPKENYIEVGPGFAFLTKEVAKKANFVFAIEKDKSFLEFYKDLSLPNVQFIIDDALNVNYDEFNVQELFGNIPYYISSDLIIKIAKSKIVRAVLLLQDEFAQRIIAKPNTKEYSSITVLTHFFFQTTFIKRFPPSFFFPRPNVYSTLVELRRIREYDSNLEDFLVFIHRAFFSKRKKLLSNLKKFYKGDFSSIFSELDINVLARPEDITEETYFKIYENMIKFCE
ncbi:MAG: 16S rRNA (adenine(1518)-N(6)/adenine(1519)-N(6))-dimethyltransferase RsmA [Caldisericaceae bacterium]